MSLSIALGVESRFGDVPLGCKDTRNLFSWCVGVGLCCVFTDVISHFVFVAYSLTGNLQRSAALWQHFPSLQAICESINCKQNLSACLFFMIPPRKHKVSVIVPSTEAARGRLKTSGILMFLKFTSIYSKHRCTHLHMKTACLHIDTQTTLSFSFNTM